MLAVHSGDTIFAPASGAGRAAICVIRLSGPASGLVIETLTGTSLPAARQLVLRTLRDPASHEVLDRALVAWLPSPQTFTGEDQAEFHVHGGAAVRAGVLAALAGFDACRPAEPGEFTRRGFLNGRMDLTCVEGLADLIDAETEAQRRQALRQLEGQLGRAVEDWRERLLVALADLEAALDFSDEGDIAAERLECQAGIQAGMVGSAIRIALESPRRGERLRDGFMVVVAGPANAGKSSLINAIARRNIAIVSDLPGTTRDVIEVRCDLNGLPVTFLDTAGLRPTSDQIELEGLARMVARAEAADLVLWLEAPDVAREPPPRTIAPGRIWHVQTKQDLSIEGKNETFAISVRLGTGIDQLLAAVESAASSSVGEGDALLTRERHRVSLQDCLEALDRLPRAVEAGQVELAAEDVRLAVRHLGRITGRVDVEEVLDRIFASFCIGK